MKGFCRLKRLLAPRRIVVFEDEALVASERHDRFFGPGAGRDCNSEEVMAREPVGILLPLAHENRVVRHVPKIGPAIDDLPVAGSRPPAAESVRTALQKLLVICRVLVSAYLIKGFAVRGGVGIGANEPVAVPDQVSIRERL